MGDAGDLGGSDSEPLGAGVEFAACYQGPVGLCRVMEKRHLHISGVIINLTYCSNDRTRLHMV